MTPILSASQVRELDRLTILEAGIPALSLMEVAGQGAAARALEVLPPGSPPVWVVAGKGNNGGDGFVLARYLASAGVPVRLACRVPTSELPAGGEARANAEVLPGYGVRAEVLDPADLESVLPGAGLIVDGLLGTGLSQRVRDPDATIIEVMNGAGPPILALDLPSGLCGDTGRVLGTAVRARWTVTFGALKRGLLEAEGPARSGEVTLVPLPFPPWALERVLAGGARPAAP